VIKQSLNVARWLAGNQCKLQLMFVELTVLGVVHATMHANTLCTHCSLFMLACDIPYSTLLQ